MDSLDGVGLVDGHDLIVGVGLVLVDVALDGLGLFDGAVPFCWAHLLKTGSAWIGLGWIGLDWIGLDWLGLHNIGASF